MKSKKFISVAVLLLFILSTLTACGFGSSASSGASSEEKTTRTKKTELATAAKNYEDEDVKKSTVTITLDGDVYGHIGQSAISVGGNAYGFGVVLDIDRIQNGSQYYVDANIAADKDSADGVGSLFSVFTSVNNNESLLHALQCFFNNDITLYAKYGAKDGTYNLKGGVNITDGTHIADNVEKTYADSSFWIADSEDNISDYISDLTYGLITPETNVDLSSYLMKTVYTELTKDSLLYGEDTANGYNDKKKVGEHKISLDAEELTSYLLTSSALSSLPVKLDKYIETISKWIKIDAETGANVHAYTADKLPKNITTTFKADINIELQSLISIIDGLRLVTAIGGEKLEKADDALYELRKIASMLKDITTNTDGKTEGYFGMTLNVTIAEDFSFAESDCKMTATTVDSDLFIASDQTTEGRYSIEEYLRIVSSVNVAEEKEELLSYLAKYYSDVKDDAESALNSAIADIGETVTADEWAEIKESVLKNLTPDVQFDLLESYVDNFCTAYDIKLTDEQKTLAKTTIRNFIEKNYTVIARADLENCIRETINTLTTSDTTKLEEKLSEWMKKLQ